MSKEKIRAAQAFLERTLCQQNRDSDALVFTKFIKMEFPDGHEIATETYVEKI